MYLYYYGGNGTQGALGAVEAGNNKQLDSDLKDAAKDGDLELVEEYIEQGANLTRSEALQAAAAYGHMEV